MLIGDRQSEHAVGSWRLRAGDLSGAVADLGILVPLTAALVVINGLRPGPVLVAAGALLVASAFNFRIPWPVQPLKALAAIAIAGGLSAEMIHAGGLLIGLILVGLTVTGLTGRLAALFTKPVIRALQLGVGGLLVVSAVRLAADPPTMFAAAAPAGWTLPLAAVTLAAVAIAAWRRWNAVAMVILVAGTAVTWIAATPTLGAVTPQLPSLVSPDPSLFAAAFVLLVIPQLPLTFGNAVVGVSDLAREQFGTRAHRASPGRVAVSCGVANVGSALIGGMPMCHGSSGFSAHVRLGARSPSMNLVLGGALLLLGLVLPGQVLALFSILPAWALAGFLVYAGLRHALLVADLRGRHLMLALVAGGAGLITGNLAITTAIALLLAHAPVLRLRAARALRLGVRA
jgi:sulfate permease, SulP family